MFRTNCAKRKHKTMELYKHNQEAYEMVMTAFRSKRKAAVIHATGTGKSIIGGAVANHFNKVLIVAPNKYVLAQASKASERAECRTYSWLSLQKSMPQSLGWQAGVENERIGFKEAYNSVRDYKERYGELPNKEHKMLRKLKESLGHNKLKDHQVALLSELGITKKSMNDIFQRKYNEIKSVYDAHGSLESLKRKDRVWIFYQQEHRGRLNKEQCEMLDAIGAFDLKKIEYNIRYHKV